MNLPFDPTTTAPWQVRLLGEVALVNGSRGIQRLPSRASAALLARLAMWPERAHAREELVELLWPGVDLPVGRNRLRQALSSLKSLLEADLPGVALVADRHHVRVVPGALACDAVLFEAAWRAGRAERALALYRGELMPGYFDEWIGDERLRLAALADRLPHASGPPSATDDGALGVGGAPAYLTRLYGRESERTRLRSEVARHRLVTLIGPGGAGKTRLAAELTTDSRNALAASLGGPGAGDDFDLVGFVHLVGCQSRGDTLQALGSALNCEAELSALQVTLSGRHALLVLDNFEHLVEAAADIPQALLARLPGLHLLITSRRVLGLDGERTLVLDTLPTPALHLPLAEAAGNPAVALFVDRARASRGDFQLAPGNLEAVLGLVQVLDGMPLALELAAARCRTLSPGDMLAMLRAEDGQGAASALELLARTGGRGDRDPRQASMERVVDWSWRLLATDAQSVLPNLTVFRAACTASAVAAVCGLRAVQAAAQLDLLAAHSLLRVARSGEGTDRFTMLEVIRQFAARRQGAAQACAARARLRHWLIDWARAEGVLPLPARIEPELPNVHAVILEAIDDGAAAQAMQLALALRDYWELDGMPAPSQQALETALAEVGPSWDDALRSDGHELLAYTSMNCGHAHSARAHADAALALAGDDARRRGRALLRRVWVQLASDYQACDISAPLDEALALARQTADPALQARVLHQQGIAMRYQRGDLAAAEQLFAQAQSLWEGLGNRRLAQARMRNRAQCWAAQGQQAQALARFRECEQAARLDSDWTGIIDSTLGMAAALVYLRRWAEALAVQRDCVAVAWRRHHAHGLAYALWNIGHPLLRAGFAEAAVRLMAFAQRYWIDHFAPLGKSDQREVARLLRLARVRLGTAAIDALWREGSALSTSEAVALALRA